MKRLSIFLGFAALAFVSCSIQEKDNAQIPQDEDLFYATTESYAEPETRVYADKDLMVLWNEDDRISIFKQFTFNQQYRFLGKTGANSGSFAKVPGEEEFITGNDIPSTYAVYPYDPETEISNQEVLTVNWPATQTYAAGSFGPGSNIMVAATDNNVLRFKNAGGYLVLKLYGQGVKVKAIALSGNDNEGLAGMAQINMPAGELPVVTMGAKASKAVTLVFPEPFSLGSSASESTECWFVLPPTTFSKGINISVIDEDDNTFTKNSTRSLTVSRNALTRMEAIEVVPTAEYPIPEAIDLGLSVKWASCNLGASTPTGYGKYFRWSETTDYTLYDENEQRTKYGTDARFGVVDNKTQLEPEDDAAHVFLGNGWRMPTKAEIDELKYNCDWYITPDYKGSGVAGAYVRGRKAGYTDKEIFIPCNGYIMPESTVIYSLGILGSFWTSTLNPMDSGEVVDGINLYNVDCAYSLEIGSLGVTEDWLVTDLMAISYGVPPYVCFYRGIRPVIDK